MTRPADLTSLPERLEQIASLISDARIPDPLRVPPSADRQLVAVLGEIQKLRGEIADTSAGGTYCGRVIVTREWQGSPESTRLCERRTGGCPWQRVDPGMQQGPTCAASADPEED